MDRELLGAIGKMMDERLQPIDRRLIGVEDRMVQMEDRLTRVEDRVTRVENRSARTKVLLENDIVTKINLLDEVRANNTNARELAETKDRMQVLETVVKPHAEDIQDMKKNIG